MAETAQPPPTAARLATAANITTMPARSGKVPVRKGRPPREETATSDPTIKRDEPGHPIHHAFTRAIPSSQCMVCHMHQPNVFVNSFYGTIMWDYESDAPFMWPKQQKYPTAEEARSLFDLAEERGVVLMEAFMYRHHPKTRKLREIFLEEVGK